MPNSWVASELTELYRNCRLATPVEESTWHCSLQFLRSPFGSDKLPVAPHVCMAFPACCPAFQESVCAVPGMALVMAPRAVILYTGAVQVQIRRDSHAGKTGAGIVVVDGLCAACGRCDSDGAAVA